MKPRTVLGAVIAIIIISNSTSELRATLDSAIKTAPRPNTEQAPKPDRGGCRRVARVVKVTYSRREYPQLASHVRAARADGYPVVMRLRRAGAQQRRDKLLDDVPTRTGHDRDEYPPAIGRRRANAAAVRYIPSSENRSAGAIMGNKLAPYCDGQRFRYRIVP